MCTIEVASPVILQNILIAIPQLHIKITWGSSEKKKKKKNPARTPSPLPTPPGYIGISGMELRRDTFTAPQEIGVYDQGENFLMG